MRIVVASITAMVLSLAAGAAFAQAQPQDLSQPTMTPASTDSGSGGGHEVVCRALYHNGMIVRTPVCHTRNEWQSMRLVTEREIEDTQIRSFTALPH